MPIDLAPPGLTLSFVPPNKTWRAVKRKKLEMQYGSTLQRAASVSSRVAREIWAGRWVDDKLGSVVFLPTGAIHIRERADHDAGLAVRWRCGWLSLIGSHIRLSRAIRRSAASGPALPAA